MGPYRALGAYMSLFGLWLIWLLIVTGHRHCPCLTHHPLIAIQSHAAAAIIKSLFLFFFKKRTKKSFGIPCGV